MKTFNHTRPIRNATGEEPGRAPVLARRVTVAELGGSFGPDARRRLAAAENRLLRKESRR